MKQVFTLFLFLHIICCNHAASAQKQHDFTLETGFGIPQLLHVGASYRFSENNAFHFSYGRINPEKKLFHTSLEHRWFISSTNSNINRRNVYFGQFLSYGKSEDEEEIVQRYSVGLNFGFTVALWKSLGINMDLGAMYLGYKNELKAPADFENDEEAPPPILPTGKVQLHYRF